MAKRKMQGPIHDDDFTPEDAKRLWDEAVEAAEDMLSWAKVRLVMGQDAATAFYASLIMQLEAKPANACQIGDKIYPIDTCALDGTHVWYNPLWMKDLSPREVLGTLIHVTQHFVMEHAARKGFREPIKWEIGADLAINTLIHEMHVDGAAVELPKGALFADDAMFKFETGLAAEEYYEKLPEGIGGKLGQQKGRSANDPGGCGTTLPPGVDDSEIEESRRDWEGRVKEAASFAKTRGDLPGWLESYCHQIDQGKIDWRHYLAEFLGAVAKNDHDWSYPNRRYVSQNIWLPALRSMELAHVMCAFDTSGSMSHDEIKDCINELIAILQRFNCPKLTALFHDVEIYSSIELSSTEPVNICEIQQGGTSHQWLPGWLAKHGHDVKCCVLFTDLATDFPHDTGVPTLWISTTDQTAPWGHTIKMVRK